jgi:adenylate kinase
VTCFGLLTTCLTGSGGFGGVGAVLGVGKSTICAKTSTGTMISTARINKPVCSAQIAKAWNNSTEPAIKTLRLAATKEGLGNAKGIAEDIEEGVEEDIKKEKL